MALPTLRLGQPSQARFSAIQVGWPGVCEKEAAVKPPIWSASLIGGASASGSGASGVPCAAHREAPQRMLPNNTIATRFILRGSNSMLCIALQAPDTSLPAPEDVLANLARAPRTSGSGS